jgi:hypothetical protein
MKETTDPAKGKLDPPTPAPVAPPASSPAMHRVRPQVLHGREREGAPTLEGDGRSHGEAGSALTGAGCVAGRLSHDGIETACRSSMGEGEGGRQPSRRHPCCPLDLRRRALAAAEPRRRVAGPYASGGEEAARVAPEGERRGGLGPTLSAPLTSKVVGY